jgi:hypothetical protein
MTRTLAKASVFKILVPLAVLCLLLVLAFTQVQIATPSQKEKGHAALAHASDGFDRPNGNLGPDWTGIHDGGLSISSHTATGRSGLTGDIWTARRFTGDQYSQIEVTSAQLASSQWIGAAVRVRDGGLDAYVGVYNWNSGSPELMLFKRSGGNWTQLGKGYSSGPLAAGAQVQVMAVGSTISLLENGIQRLSVSDSSFAGGAPGIMVYGDGKAGNWSAADVNASATFHVHYMRTDADGVKWYQVISPDNGPAPQVLRVLAPTDPARGVSHNFLYVLPVQAGSGHTFKDGLETLRRLNAQNRYNLTIVAPSFAIDPWYADNPKEPNVKYESFIAKELVPWVMKNLAVTGHEQNWLIGFSKSGLGAQDLILKHPDIFALAASWDFPADMSSYDQYGADPAASYGTNANFQANYRLTPAFLDAHKRPFLDENRIWIGGSTEFPTDMSNYARLLTQEGIRHTTESSSPMRHSWTSGWVPIALAALWHDSIEFRSRQ